MICFVSLFCIWKLPLIGSLSKQNEGRTIKVYIGRIGKPYDPSTFTPLYTNSLLCSSIERQKSTVSKPHIMIGRKPEYINMSFILNENIIPTQFCKDRLNGKHVKDVINLIRNNYEYEFLIDKYSIWVPIGTNFVNLSDENSKTYTGLFTHFTINITNDNGKVKECNVTSSNPVEMKSYKTIKFTFEYNYKDAEIAPFNTFKTDHETISFKKLSMSIFECIVLLIFVLYNINNLFPYDSKTKSRKFACYFLHGDIFRSPFQSKIFCFILGIICHVAFCFVSIIIYYVLFENKEPHSDHINTEYISASTVLSSFLSLFRCAAFIQGFATTSLCNMFLIEESLRMSILGIIVEYALYGTLMFPINIIGNQASSSFSYTGLISSFLNCFVYYILPSLAFSTIGNIISFRYDVLGKKPCETLPFQKTNKRPPFLYNSLNTAIVFSLLISSSVQDQFINLLISLWNCDSSGVSILSLLLSVLFCALSSSLISLIFTSSRILYKSPRWQWYCLLAPFCIVVVLLISAYVFCSDIIGTPSILKYVIYYTISLFIAFIYCALSSCVSYLSSFIFLRCVFITKKQL